MRQAKTVLLGLLLFSVVITTYYLSPVVVTTDSRYTMLVSEHFLLTGSLAVDQRFSPYVDSSGYPGFQVVRNGVLLPRQIRPYQGHLYNVYPPGTAVLSAPLVFLMRALLDESVFKEDGTYRHPIERLWQKRIAALVTASTCLVLFLMASLVLTLPASFLLALSAAFSSQLWSTASRSLWSHTWLTLQLSLALFLLLRWRVRGEGLRPVLLGTLLSAAFFTRPTAAAIILPITLLVLVKDRRQGMLLICTGAAWCGLLVLHSYSAFGELLPPYYVANVTDLSLANLPVGLEGQWLSPSRGLFVFVPLTLMAFYLVLRHWRFLLHRDLVIAVLAAVGFHSLGLVLSELWWGGHCFGPRYSTDLVPLFAVMGIEGYAAATGSGSPAQIRRIWVAFLVLFSVGALINGAGAVHQRGMLWNRGPPTILADPSRALDWEQSQLMCALFESRCP